MSAFTRLPLLVLAVVLALPVAAWGDEPRTGQRGDELEDRIPAVSGHLFLKKGRVELTPTVGLSLADPFHQKLSAGAGLTWHFLESWAVTLRGGYTVSRFTPPTVQVCPEPDTCRAPNDTELGELPGNLTMLGSAAVEFSPLYGKINFIAEQVMHFDLFVTVGGAVAAYDLVIDGVDESGLGPGLLLGVGQRFFLNEWLAVKLEVLDLVYQQPTARSDGDPRLHNQLMVGAGVSLFLPTGFTREG